jgi:predicted RNase H-like HicB family nuclease
MTAQRYLIVIEGDDHTNYSAYSPDVPGVAATGASREECEREMRDAIEFHLEGLTEDGEVLPEPHSTASYAVVDVG